ncbi:MAG: hypothetical protein K5984_02385 [Bacteroidales bacterium]|nr:hypothetical protein [Bacteroidales bacterium]
MKKTILVIIAALAFTAVASAQPRAVGIRFGYGYEAQYQHWFGWESFLDVTTGVDAAGDNGIKATATYNWELFNPAWGGPWNGVWTWYAGPGVSVGNVNCGTKGNNPGFMIGLAVQVGCEYTVGHLAVAGDLRPVIGYHAGDDHFYRAGMMGFIPTLSVKYKF